ncbi:polysaccharide deacetylase family protein [Brevibacillus humidisoli]|uniref:polysaccharide deacetylase family protein n=1 Tax=Brevibacillus humidisoli TaxID=2895522 RepID=UPI001E5254C4|nr:polysaccharide deacetylase family protein [Brevibacillus humidisoli]UFJ40069.1 polysaccharide deacetylase family protein [Brevibacillus humidisoli]
MFRRFPYLIVMTAVITLVMVGLFLLTNTKMAKDVDNMQHFPPSPTSKDHRQNDSTIEAPLPSTDVPTPKPLQEQTWYRDQVVVLMYHHIADNPQTRYVIRPEQFASHMAFLHENDLRPISLGEFLRFVDTGVLLTKNAVLITFDDGYESYYKEAFPVLEKYGYPSVNFVIAGNLRDVQGRKRENMISPLSHSQIAEMTGSGLVELGSHTYSLHAMEIASEWGELGPRTSPVYLEDLHRVEKEEEYRDRLFVDFKMSRAALKDLIGHQVTSISLPYGYFNDTVLETARQAGYRHIFTSLPGLVAEDVNPIEIPRYDVGLQDFDENRLRQLFQSVRMK